MAEVNLIEYCEKAHGICRDCEVMHLCAEQQSRRLDESNSPAEDDFPHDNT